MARLQFQDPHKNCRNRIYVLLCLSSFLGFSRTLFLFQSPNPRTETLLLKGIPCDNLLSHFLITAVHSNFSVIITQSDFLITTCWWLVFVYSLTKQFIIKNLLCIKLFHQHQRECIYEWNQFPALEEFINWKN